MCPGTADSCLRSPDCDRVYRALHYKNGENASRILGAAVLCAYISSILAAFLSMGAGDILIPRLSAASSAGGLRELPEAVFQLDIPQIMPGMSAFVFSVFDPVRVCPAA